MHRPDIGSLAIFICIVLGGCSGGGENDQRAADATDSVIEPTIGVTPAATTPGRTDDASGPAGDDPGPPGDPATAPTAPLASDPTVDTEPPSTEGGGQSLGPLGDTQIDLATDAGTVQIGSADIPDAALDFPVPADLVVLLASETDSDLGFSGESQLSIDDLAAFYERELVRAGFRITGRNVIPGLLAVFNFENSPAVGQVAVSAAGSGDGSAVIVVLGDGQGEEDSVPP